jgi:hypothetical protein
MIHTNTHTHTDLYGRMPHAAPVTLSPLEINLILAHSIVTKPSLLSHLPRNTDLSLGGLID